MKHFCRDTPVILIGCKTDLRQEEECCRKLKATDQAPITYSQVRYEGEFRHFATCKKKKKWGVRSQDVNCDVQEEAR